MTSWDQYDSDGDDNAKNDQEIILEAKIDLFLRKYARFPLKVIKLYVTFYNQKYRRKN